MKSVYAGYVLAIVIILAAMWAIHQYVEDPRGWYYAIPMIALVPPINAQAKRRMITLRFHDDHLTLETGFLARTQRTLDTAKIQDVTVQQSFGQRLMGTGDLRFEDSGQSGGMTIRNLDRPRELAAEIISSSKRPRG
jgi:uncharacterized membrane protein YdbT with pleckstrin-like domain